MSVDSTILNSLITQLKTIIPNVSNPVQLIAQGMEIAESFPSLSGVQKKQYLVLAIEQLSKDGLLPVSIATTIEALINGNAIQDTISVLVDATKGKFNINKIVTTAQEDVIAVSGCLSCLTTKK